MNIFPEVNRESRGHAFYENLTDIPALYETEETPVAEKIVLAHFFAPNCDFYVVELNPEDGEAFGYTKFCNHQDGEWGYIDLLTLESHQPSPGDNGIGLIERDLHWTPKKFSEIRRD